MDVHQELTRAERRDGREAAQHGVDSPTQQSARPCRSTKIFRASNGSRAPPGRKTRSPTSGFRWRGAAPLPRAPTWRCNHARRALGLPLFEPSQQCLARATDHRCDGFDCCPQRRMLAALLSMQMYGPLSDLGENLVCLLMGSILSRTGAPTKRGTVQSFVQMESAPYVARNAAMYCRGLIHSRAFEESFFAYWRKIYL